MFSRAISVVRIIVMITLFSGFLNEQIIAQQLDNSILQNTVWLEKSEAKKWEKQLNELEKAEKLLKENNDKFLEIGNVENNEKLDADKKAKTIQKLEEEALKGSLESLEKYKAIYVELVDIIELKLEDEHREHPSYKLMNTYLEQAELAYSKTDETEGFNKTEKLTAANEYQLRAIESGINIFTSPAVSYNEQQYETPENIIPDDDIVIDAQLLKMYQEYKNDGSIQDPLTAYKLMNLQENQVTYSNFEEIWYRYQNNELETNQAANEIAEVRDSTLVSVDSSVLLANSNESELNMADENIPQFTNTSTSGTTQQNHTENKPQDIKSGTEISKQTAETVSSVLNNSQKSTSESAKNSYSSVSKSMVSSDYEFRVQIAASQSPLSINHIETIYQGSLPVIEIKEGKYFKYQIKGFNQLSEAQRVCSETRVNNAYIEAYKSLERVRLNEAANATIGNASSRKSHSLEFAVQFAASRVRLSDKRVSEIYNYPQEYRIVFEKGWYKYQVYAGENLENAFGILEGLNIEKAFIVAYKNGQKLKLYNAIQEYKRNLP